MTTIIMNNIKRLKTMFESTTSSPSQHISNDNNILICSNGTGIIPIHETIDERDKIIFKGYDKPPSPTVLLWKTMRHGTLYATQAMRDSHPLIFNDTIYKCHSVSLIQNNNTTYVVMIEENINNVHRHICTNAEMETKQLINPYDYVKFDETREDTIINTVENTTGLIVERHKSLATWDCSQTYAKLDWFCQSVCYLSRVCFDEEKGYNKNLTNYFNVLNNTKNKKYINNVYFIDIEYLITLKPDDKENINVCDKNTECTYNMSSIDLRLIKEAYNAINPISNVKNFRNTIDDYSSPIFTHIRQNEKYHL